MSISSIAQNFSYFSEAVTNEQSGEKTESSYIEKVLYWAGIAIRIAAAGMLLDKVYTQSQIMLTAVFLPPICLDFIPPKDNSHYSEDSGIFVFFKNKFQALVNTDSYWQSAYNLSLLSLKIIMGTIFVIGPSSVPNIAVALGEVSLVASTTLSSKAPNIARLGALKSVKDL